MAARSGLAAALRERSSELLLTDLVSLLTTGEEEWTTDHRDLMVAMTPHHDLAHRIGTDPLTLFTQAAALGPPSLADAVLAFGARTDITPEAFGFTFDPTSDPPYRPSG